jgi:UDP-glucose 4-epimerase
MILLTGATGYIGSHTWLALLNAGYQVIGIDNFSNSNPLVLERLRTLASQEIFFEQGDVCDSHFLNNVYKKYPIEGVTHFAAYKAVGESVQNPIKYYENNINGLLNLLRVAGLYNCNKLVFSSSATVYHPGNSIPYTEGMRLGSTSPYGWTKYMCEQILRDCEIAEPDLRVAYLRYFNPIGAHHSGLIGEAPVGVPNNLMPYLTQVAVGKREYLSIYGNDWPTHDGTGVRDYIHVVDLAKGHIQALNYLMTNDQSLTVNLGTGKGYSVLDLVHAFERSTGIQVPYKFMDRRDGDIAAFYADPSLAKTLMGWSVEYDLEKMCRDSWNWQSKNPNGYSKP